MVETAEGVENSGTLTISSSLRVLLLPCPLAQAEMSTPMSKQRSLLSVPDVWPIQETGKSEVPGELVRAAVTAVTGATSVRPISEAAEAEPAVMRAMGETGETRPWIILRTELSQRPDREAAAAEAEPVEELP